MQSIKQTTETSFVALNFVDAIRVLPIMDGLMSYQKELSQYQLDENPKSKWGEPIIKFGRAEIKLNGEQLKLILSTLRECGFRSSFD